MRICVGLILGFAAAAVYAEDVSVDLMTPHQRALFEHRDVPAHPDLINGPVALPLRAASSDSCRIVFGYLPYWESAANIQWDKLTHLGLFSVGVNSAGNTTPASGWPWAGAVNSAHANGVKVHLVVTLFDGPDIVTLINSPTNKANFFQNIRDRVITANADGVNIDFESGSGWQGQMDEFMGELGAYLEAEIPGQDETSIATAAVNWGNAWQFGNLVNNTDIVFIMCYAFAGSWSSTTGPGSPLTGGSINLTDTVVNEYADARAIAPEKLVLGIPYYGLHWTADSSAARATALSFINSPRYSSAQPESLIHGVQWDAASQTPWYRYQVGSTWHQVWFDNVDSTRLKYQLAKDYDLGGVGMWALNYDGTRPELWDLIQEEFIDICCDENPPGQLVFSETFDDGAASAARWNVFASSSDYTAEFGVDYSALGIPEAPNSTGGQTRGLKFTVNNNDAVESTEAVNAYPVGKSFSGDYALKFDMWMNYAGGSGGGTGSTEFMLAGIAHAGDRVSWPENLSSDGNYFGVTGEGGSTTDYRAYLGKNMYQIFHGVYSAPSLNNTDGYYQTVMPTPPFETSGAPGKQWVEVEVRREGSTTTWSIDGTQIAAIPALGTGDNIMLGYMDEVASIADPAADNFIIYDNVRVEMVAAADCNANTFADSCELIAGGDFDADGDVDELDTAWFVDCLSGAGGVPQPTATGCAGTCLSAFDFDGDLDLDLDDFAAYQSIYGNGS